MDNTVLCSLSELIGKKNKEPVIINEIKNEFNLILFKYIWECNLYIGIPKKKKYKHIITDDTESYQEILSNLNFGEYIYVPEKEELHEECNKRKYHWIVFPIRSFLFNTCGKLMDISRYYRENNDTVIYWPKMTSEKLSKYINIMDNIFSITINDIDNILNTLINYNELKHNICKFENEINEINELI